MQIRVTRVEKELRMSNPNRFHELKEFIRSLDEVST